MFSIQTNFIEIKFVLNDDDELLLPGENEREREFAFICVCVA